MIQTAFNFNRCYTQPLQSQLEGTAALHSASSEGLRRGKVDFRGENNDRNRGDV